MNLVVKQLSGQQAAIDQEPHLLHEFFERQVLLRPAHPAIQCGDETLTYSQLDEAAERIAAFLRARGVVTGSLVALFHEKSCELFAAMLGILKAGAGYVPLDPQFPVARVVSILEDANVEIVITDRDLGRDLARQTRAEVIYLGEDITHDLRSAPPLQPAIVSSSDVCYVIYTSGSTGRPKGVVIEHRNAINFVHSLRNVYKLTPRDRIYQGFSLAFDASVEEIWGAWAIGGTLVVPSSEIARSALDAASFITSHELTYFSTVPSFLGMIRSDLPTVTLLVLGGEACPQELANRWVTPNRRLMNTYGPTEATVVTTAIDCVPGQTVTIGTALPGYTVHVLDEKMQPVKPGEIGEIYIGGASIARGYLNRPDLTAEHFIKDPFNRDPDAKARLYRTRDLATLTADGNVQFIGRADAQVKIRGFRIELSEIEAVLMEHPSIQTAVVNVVEFGHLKEIAAYVVLEGHVSTLDRDSVVELLRTRLPEYMVPRYLDVVTELPQMTSSKVDRKLLPPPVAILGRSKHEVVEPQTPTERAIIEIWQQVFKTSPISVDDDFFLDLRGHSLFAAQAVTELRVRLSTILLSIPDIYEYRTARRLAEHLDAIKSVDPESTQASAFEQRPPLSAFRYPCAALQFLGLMAFYIVLFSPFVFAVVLCLKVRDGEVSVLDAINLATTVALLIWPCWVLLSIAVKWLVIGRYKPGRYPVWGFYYFRWWLASRFQALSWSEMFVGTPLMSLYYRAMGAKVGRYCSIDTPHCTAYDLICIGADTSIGAETHIEGYRIENGWLILGRVDIGTECFVGTQCYLGLDVQMGNRARLDDMSLLTDGAAVQADHGMRGSPAAMADVDLDLLQASAGPARYRRLRTFAYGFIHLALIYAMGYLLILSALPGLVMVLFAFFTSGPLLAVLAAFAAVPVSLVWYLFLVVFVKRKAIGHIAPGIYRQLSRDYLRSWFLAYLMNNTRTIVLPLFATLYLPSFLRMLGAKIGYEVEVSTVMNFVPDLLELDDGSFLADGCIVGGNRSYLGLVQLRGNRIGKRSFVGNSAMVPAGIDIDENCLIGVMSTPPLGVRHTTAGTRWLGSPGFELPHTQEVSEFSEKETYSPTAGLTISRGIVELFRLIVPDLIMVGELMLFCIIAAITYYLLPLWALAVVMPVTAYLLSFVTVAVVADLKGLLMGEFEPVVKPLWSSYVWLNDVVNATYETAAATAMTPLMGTPFIAQCLRMMGCKVGRWVFMETTLFSEFDLVEIGDFAALNLGVTVQTHLFEDRVMKSDRLKIGDGCSIGNMAVVLYGSEMQQGSSLGALSVLMKGETLPAFTRWAGIPTRPVGPLVSMPLQSAQPTPVVPVVEAPAKTVRISKAELREQSIRRRVDWLLSSAANAGKAASKSDRL